MSLRTKTILIGGISLICAVAILYAMSRLILMSGLSRIEEQNTQKDIQRVAAVVSQDVSELEATTGHWSAWDDTYNFVEDVNKDYIEKNLADSSFADLRLNLMLFVNSSGRVVFSEGFDLQQEKEVPVSPQLLDYSFRTSVLGGHPETESSMSGIILLDEGPMIIDSQPILKSDYSGPVHGTLIFGRYLNDSELNRLAQLTLSKLTIGRIDRSLPSDFDKALNSLSAKRPVVVQTLDTQYTAGYTFLDDIRGEPAVILIVTVPRDIRSLGEVTIVYLVLSLFGVGLLLSVAVIFIVQKQILSRFASVLPGLNKIIATGDRATRLPVSGNDELTLVARTMNEVLAALQQSEAEIREREERYRDLFDNAVELIHSTSLDGHFLYVNQAWHKALGYSEEDVKNLTVWDIVHPDYRARFAETREKVMSGEPAQNIQTVFVTKREKLLTVEGNMGAQLNEGKPMAIRGIYHDVTERDQAQKRLQQLYDQEKALRQELEREIQKRIEYTRALVHELKTPITPILAAVDLLLEKIREAPLRSLAESVSRSAANLNRRIDELLDLARSELDMLRIYPELMSPTALLRDIAHEMMPLASRNRQSLVFETPLSLPSIEADRDRVRQVILNLLSNALKVTPAGGEITVSAEQDGKNLVIAVSDTGPGISEEQQKRLFVAYYRGEDDRQRLSGLGLGLALAKVFVELHGGRIWVKSEKRKGTTFSFSLPLVAHKRKKTEVESGGKS
jgi:PAS domain S-box-containing protein